MSDFILRFILDNYKHLFDIYDCLVMKMLNKKYNSYFQIYKYVYNNDIILWYYNNNNSFCYKFIKYIRRYYLVINVRHSTLEILIKNIGYNLVDYINRIENIILLDIFEYLINNDFTNNVIIYNYKNKNKWINNNYIKYINFDNTINFNKNDVIKIYSIIRPKQKNYLENSL